METIILFVFVAVIYFIPYVVARERNHENTFGILIFNLFFGWTVVGWFVALVWALSKSKSGAAAPPLESASKTAPRSESVFKAEGVLRGIPYRVEEGGTVEAMMQGGLVRFANMDQFRAASEGRDA